MYCKSLITLLGQKNGFVINREFSKPLHKTDDCTKSDCVDLL